MPLPRLIPPPGRKRPIDASPEISPLRQLAVRPATGADCDPSNTNERQRAFAQEFIADYNATNAAIRLGPCTSYPQGDPELNGWPSRNLAQQAGHALVNHPAVRALIREYQTEQLNLGFITNDRIKLELAKLAFSNILHYVKPVRGGYILEYADFDKIDGAAIQAIEPTKDGQVKIKLHKKVDALVKLAMMHGMFEVDNQQRRPVIVIGEEGELDEVEEARE